MHIRKCPTLLVIKEMVVKPTLRHHFSNYWDIHYFFLSRKRVSVASETIALVQHWWDCKMGQSFWKTA